jgi:hypothetical protein
MQISAFDIYGCIYNTKNSQKAPQKYSRLSSAAIRSSCWVIRGAGGRSASICWNIKLGACFLNLSEYFDVEDKFQKPIILRYVYKFINFLEISFVKRMHF